MTARARSVAFLFDHIKETFGAHLARRFRQEAEKPCGHCEFEGDPGQIIYCPRHDPENVEKLIAVAGNILGHLEELDTVISAMEAK